MHKIGQTSSFLGILAKTVSVTKVARTWRSQSHSIYICRRLFTCEIVKYSKNRPFDMFEYWHTKVGTSKWNNDYNLSYGTGKMIERHEFLLEITSPIHCLDWCLQQQNGQGIYQNDGAVNWKPDHNEFPPAVCVITRTYSCTSMLEITWK